MTIVYLIVLVLTVASAYYYKKDLFSPVRMFICLYCLFLAVDSLHFSDYQTTWSPTSHLLFWGGIGMFIAGCGIMLLVNRVSNPTKAFDFPSIRSGIAQDALTIDWKWFFTVWAVALGCFFAGYVMSYLIAGFIPLFSRDPDRMRITFITASVVSNAGIFCGPLSLMLGAELLLFGKLDKRTNALVWAGCIAVFLAYFTIMTRHDIFRFFLFFFVVYHYGRKNFSLARVGAAAGFCLVLFLVFFFIRSNIASWVIFTRMLHMHMPKELFWTSNWYVYIVNNFWNFDFAVRKFVEGAGYYPQQFGYSLLRPCLYFFHLDYSLGVSMGFDSILNESVTKVKGLNTIGFQWHFFKDFGASGVYMLSLLWGMITTVFYANTLNAPSLFRVSMLGIIAGFILMSHANPIWEFWFVYVNVLFLAVAHRRLTLSA
jgi:oligosaccharide repeat unit polymerase